MRAGSNWGPDTEKTSLGLVRFPSKAEVLVGAEHRVRTGDLRLGKATRPRRHPSPILTNRHQLSGFIQGAEHPLKPILQRSPTVHSRCVPQVFQDGARQLDVAQVAVLLGWTRDAVRAACEPGDLPHWRDQLNAYRIPCSAVAAVASATQSQQC